MNRAKGVSLTTKLTVSSLVLIILCTAVTGLFGYALHRRDSINQSAQRAMGIANGVALAIDPVQYAEIMASKEKSPYWETLKIYADRVKVSNGLQYLYVVDRSHSGTVTYFLEGNAPDDDPSEIMDLGDPDDAVAYASEMFDTIATGVPSVTDIYDSEGYGLMVSAFTPIMDQSGRVLAAVGVDISVDDVVRSSNTFGMQIILIVIAFALIVGLTSISMIKRMIGTPIRELTNASSRMAEGDMNIELRSASRDEIGALVASFKSMIESSQKQIAAVELLADGDLRAEVSARGVHDAMMISMQKMITSLSDMFKDIRSATAEVSAGARQIADGAQRLAEGAVDQASVVEELSAAASSVSERTKDNVSLAEKATELTGTIKGDAHKGSAQMARMTEAVSEINDASRAISKVIKVINDIAMQTNILALNASIEAARAGGQVGKGFAVVAEEVRNLAVKSAAAAKDTENLIANSMKKAELGATIAGETALALDGIVSAINESNAIIGDIARSAEEQSVAIAQINEGIERVRMVVTQNTATAQESAAASAVMSDQSETLASMVTRFRFKDDSARISPVRKTPALGAGERSSDVSGYGKY